jgi:peptide/nickel transport system permease protein
MAGMVRVMTFKQGALDYVAASKTLGTPNIMIMFREVLPNLVSIISSFLTIMLAGNMGLETGLTFLGFGLPPGTPSLGTLIANARNPATMQNRPWQWLPAALLVFILMLCINFVGQALNRAADAKKRKV